MRYCWRCGHAAILHIDHFIHGDQQCDVNDCPCEQYQERN